MDQSPDRVEHFSKVALTIEVGTAVDRFELTPSPVPHEFIFGIGAAGLSPFEFRLGGLSVGDEVVMQVAAVEICRLFGPGGSPPLPLEAGTDDLFLRARVTGVARAADRDIIKAMAAMADCSGCGGDCCGHHH